MPKYKGIVASSMDFSIEVEVEADSEDEAIDLMIKQAEDSPLSHWNQIDSWQNSTVDLEEE
jgi:hypothetical protein